MRRLIGLGIALAGCVCIALGVANGEVRGVFLKAVMICFECIGIG